MDRCDRSKTPNFGSVLRSGPELWIGVLPQMWQLGRLLRWTVAGAIFGALWCMLIERLARYWVVEPEYNFGWLVPILCGYLFWLRWRSRPAPGAPKVGLARCVFWVTALGLLPIWLIVQANPDWERSSLVTCRPDGDLIALRDLLVRRKDLVKSFRI